MQDFLEVTEVVWHSPGIFELRARRNGLAFVPGDCLALFGEDGAASRPYSIASGQQEEEIRFLIRRMPGGEVSGFLAERKPGDRVKCSPPFGWFRPGPRKDGAPFVFVATGTGIAPFLAHLRSHPDAPPLKCLYGVRHLADAVERDWLRGVCDLRLAVSREMVEGAAHGRVTDLLDDLPIAPGMHFYLCGLDAMIDDVSQWLEARGVPVPHIHRECFFNAA